MVNEVTIRIDRESKICHGNVILIEKQVRMGAEKKEEGYYEGYLISACTLMVINNA